MDVMIKARMTRQNVTIDHITCTCRNKTYRMQWECGEWTLDSCGTGYRYAARLRGASLEDEAENEIWLNGKMDLLRRCTKFECYFTALDTDED